VTGLKSTGPWTNVYLNHMASS